MKIHRIIRVSLWLAAALLIVIIVCNGWLLIANRERVFRNDAAVPARDVALVLGTAPRVGRGFKNPFFEGRMDAAASLWREGKVRHLLVSGDNGRQEYNEPVAMRDALVARGVPADAITLDYAGFRTFDSLVRARQVFGVKRLIVVTDDWHQPRTLFLASAAGLDAVGACSADVPWGISKMTRIREWLSRVKAVADLYILRTKPRFLGERITLQIAPRKM